MSSTDIQQHLGLSDADLDALAAPYEEGTWEGPTGPVVMGRPRLYEEEMRTISLRVPASRVPALDALAEARGQTRSELLRQVIDSALLAG